MVRCGVLCLAVFVVLAGDMVDMVDMVDILDILDMGHASIYRCIVDPHCYGVHSTMPNYGTITHDTTHDIPLLSRSQHTVAQSGDARGSHPDLPVSQPQHVSVSVAHAVPQRRAAALPVAQSFELRLYPSQSGP